jgi:hypothetical protein
MSHGLDNSSGRRHSSTFAFGRGRASHAGRILLDASADQELTGASDVDGHESSTRRA